MQAMQRLALSAAYGLFGFVSITMAAMFMAILFDIPDKNIYWMVCRFTTANLAQLSGYQPDPEMEKRLNSAPLPEPLEQTAQPIPFTAQELTEREKLRRQLEQMTEGEHGI